MIFTREGKVINTLEPESKKRVILWDEDIEAEELLKFKSELKKSVK